MTTGKDHGALAERLVHQFFDSHLSKFFSFPYAHNRQKAQVADVVVWHNRQVFLVEVKARDEGSASLESWATWRIQQATKQICRNYERFLRQEEIFLHNDYFHVKLDHEGITYHTGLIVLAYDGICNVLPTDAVPDIYKRPLPIYVLSWNDLGALSAEIDTVPDFFYYLQDRRKYLQKADIPLDAEREVVSYYKLHLNSFPDESPDFKTSSFADEYSEVMADAINRRAAHNENSVLIDALEQCFSEQRKQFLGLPLGLYFVWELGSQTRRVRAYFGEKLHSIKQDFINGKSSRQFAVQNPSTGNWLVFYFGKGDIRAIHEELLRLVKLKLIKELHINNFDYGVYGFGFQVSKTLPVRSEGLASAIVMGSDEVRGYGEDELKLAIRVWGAQKNTSTWRVLEYPESRIR
jgi:hypothetical protein